MKKRIRSYFAIAPFIAFAMSIAGGNASAAALLTANLERLLSGGAVVRN